MAATVNAKDRPRHILREELRRRCREELAELLRGGPHGLDELRHPFVPAPQVFSIHGLELGSREGMRRGTVEQGFAPRPEARVVLNVAKLLDPVEENVAL